MAVTESQPIGYEVARCSTLTDGPRVYRKYEFVPLKEVDGKPMLQSLLDQGFLIPIYSDHGYYSLRPPEPDAPEGA